MPTQAERTAAYISREIQSIDELKARIKRLPFSGCSRREALELAAFLADHAVAATDTNKTIAAEYARLSIRCWQIARRCSSC